MAEDKAFLRVSDLAPVLDVTAGRIYQLIADGEIPAVKVGGAIRIPRQAWEQWLAGKSEQALASIR
jgi:excisionase family DNA binding protein